MVYLITDGGALRKQGKLIWAINEALQGADGKIDYVQLREPDLEDSELIELAQTIKILCKKYSAKFILNKRYDLIDAAGADGVHLGAASSDVSSIEKEIEGKETGYSAHSVDEALSVSSDYLFLSPIFDPISKRKERKALGLNALKELSSRTTKPVFALGGISPENAMLCREAGAYGVATIGSVLLQADPRMAAERLVLAWEGHLYASAAFA